MTVIVRFAPSPTGRLHVGNLRPAIFNWLFARKAGGTFILRFDDTDVERSREEFVDAIRTDLTWLGLTWDRDFRQSDRTAQYQAALDTLAASGRAYPCFETAADLDRKRKRQLARGLPPVYDRAALKLSPEDIAAKRAEGAVPHWRFKLDQVRTPWDDLIRGPQEIDAGSLSDPVIAREDGSFLYTFTSVVDDAAEAISHIIRGEDHVANTAVQIQLFEALGAAVPLFAHHNLLVGADGQALSKRLGSLAIGSFREGGYEPLAVACHAALIGTSDPVAPLADMVALADLFDFAKLSRAPARFDPEELRALNGKLLQSLSFEAVAERLNALGISGGEPFWLAVRGNIAVFADVASWWRLIAEPVTPVIAEPAFCEEALALLPDEPWDVGTWDQWTARIKAETGAKGRALFMPLRLALTGLEHGPELKYLLPLMGRARVAQRLAGKPA